MRENEHEHEHEAQAAAHMGRMGDAQERMERCVAGQGMPRRGETAESVRSFHDTRAAMGEAMHHAADEVAQHMRRMLEAADVDSALAEEHRHSAEIHRHLERLRAELKHGMDAMERSGMSMMCPATSHMHRQP